MKPEVPMPKGQAPWKRPRVQKRMKRELIFKLDQGRTLQLHPDGGQ
jgi:hypothetical protein